MPVVPHKAESSPIGFNPTFPPLRSNFQPPSAPRTHKNTCQQLHPTPLHTPLGSTQLCSSTPRSAAPHADTFCYCDHCCQHWNSPSIARIGTRLPSDSRDCKDCMHDGHHRTQAMQFSRLYHLKSPTWTVLRHAPCRPHADSSR